MSQMKAKLSKIESLERELSDTQGVFRETNGSYLKSAPRCVDLTDKHHYLQGETNRLKSWTEEEDIGDEHAHVGGMGLHRCTKITDIRLKLQEEDIMAEKEDLIWVDSMQNEKDIEQCEDANVKTGKQNEEEGEQEDEEEEEADSEVEEKEVLTSKPCETKPLLNTGNPQTLAMEGVSASEKRMSAIRRGLTRDASGSTTFLKSAQNTGLRSTGSSSTFRTTSARKQK
ncbi:uncharacterized protein LOC124260762 isoform X2 [Haliotis rubra]|uniref:uncharacterized protein LOC124260762 isoform X2 n=1 Tax=Haliotis rubra TaxID=36100 RepID=UPI001EE5AE61|nr:uncharacterized protein LOC124260762 isoform X2 [Haliotis rubra]